MPYRRRGAAAPCWFSRSLSAICLSERSFASRSHIFGFTIKTAFDYTLGTVRARERDIGRTSLPGRWAQGNLVAVRTSLHPLHESSSNARRRDSLFASALRFAMPSMDSNSLRVRASVRPSVRTECRQLLLISPTHQSSAMTFLSAMLLEGRLDDNLISAVPIMKEASKVYRVKVRPRPSPNEALSELRILVKGWLS